MKPSQNSCVTHLYTHSKVTYLCITSHDFLEKTQALFNIPVWYPPISYLLIHKLILKSSDSTIKLVFIFLISSNISIRSSIQQSLRILLIVCKFTRVNIFHMSFKKPLTFLILFIQAISSQMNQSITNYICNLINILIKSQDI